MPRWLQYLGSKLLSLAAQSTPEGMPTVNVIGKAEEIVGYDDSTSDKQQPDDSETVACSEKGWTMRVERSWTCENAAYTVTG